MHNSDNHLQAIDSIAKLVIEISPELFSLLKDIIATNRQIESQLKVLDKKLDNLILREIQSAFQMIDSLAYIESENMKDRHLTEAERNLLKNICLDPTLTTAGKNNSYWSAQAFYGLSLIALLRKEEIDATRFLLQTFLVCPSEARKTLAKKLYTEKIEPQCKVIIEKYEAEFKNISEYNKEISRLRGEIGKKRVLQGVIGGLGITVKALQAPAKSRNITIPDSVFYTVGQQVQRVNEDIDSLKEQLENIPKEETLRARYENELDAKCRQIAKELLAK